MLKVVRVNQMYLPTKERIVLIKIQYIATDHDHSSTCMHGIVDVANFLGRTFQELHTCNGD